MNLDAIEGIGDATRKKLNSAGIRTVKDLATLDTRSASVKGVSRERLQELKKAAQRTLYQAASQRVVTAAKATGRAVADSWTVVEQQTRAAVREALEAAWEAEHRALEALRASQTKATSLAEAAAHHAQAAQRVAQEKARFVLAQIQKAPERARGAWERYGASATQAEAKASEAARRATQAANQAGGAVEEPEAAVGEKDRGLMHRVKGYWSRADA